MAQEYYAILTNAGLAYEAQQKAQNKPITLTAMAIGDGNGAAYNPDPAAVALRREVHRQPLNALLQDANNPTWLVCEAVLADNVGGWTIREVGIYTDTGILYSIAKYADSVKPLLSTGSGKQFYVRAIFQTSNAASVTLLVDNSVVMAPRSFVIDHVRDELAKRDHKQSVRVATVGPITLSGEQSIDGVAVVAGDRVLVKDQEAAATNGIYVAAAGVWTRATDADSGAKLNPGATVPVESGVVNADTQWTLKTDGQVAVGTTALVFVWSGGQRAPDSPAGDRSQRVANTAFVGAAVESMAAGHMFQTGKWMGARGALPEGWFAMDGFPITELQVPGIREALTAAGIEVVTEEVWQSDPLQRGKWSSGESGWVRLPDWNGVQSGSIGGLYFGGDLGGSRRSAIVSDAIRNIEGTLAGAGINRYTKAATGAIKVAEGAIETLATGTISIPAVNFTFDASRVVPTAEENRPKSVYGTWMIRLYGGFTQLGALNAAALVAEANALKTRVSVLEARHKAIGDDQNRVDVTASRALATVYTNTTGRAIVVGAEGASTAANADMSITVTNADGSISSAFSSSFLPVSGWGLRVQAIVLANEKYRIDATSAAKSKVWEIR